MLTEQDWLEPGSLTARNLQRPRCANALLPLQATDGRDHIDTTRLETQEKQQTSSWQDKPQSRLSKDPYFPSACAGQARNTVWSAAESVYQNRPWSVFTEDPYVGGYLASAESDGNIANVSSSSVSASASTATDTAFPVHVISLPPVSSTDDRCSSWFDNACTCVFVCAPDSGRVRDAIDWTSCVGACEARARDCREWGFGQDWRAGELGLVFFLLLFLVFASNRIHY